MYSYEEQIEATIHRNQFELIRKYVPDRDLTLEDYKKAFTIEFTTEELSNYLQSNYQLSDFVKFTPTDKDGFYAVEENGSWLTYDQERRIHIDELRVHSVPEVWNRYVIAHLGISR